jgi:hypothetical protein
MARIRLDKDLIQWIRTTAGEAKNDPDVGGNLLTQKQAVETLRQVNPTLARKLERMDLLDLFGVALEYRYRQRVLELRAQGYGADAKPMAMQEWFDLEPETESPKTSPL